MRVGSLVFATDQGLGYLAKAFYDNGIVTDPIVVRHGRRPTHTEWYPGAPVLSDLTARALIEVDRVLDVVDAMLCFETPFLWEVFNRAREKNVRTFLMPMYECMPSRLPVEPDRYICPSLLDLRYFPDRSVHIPVPVKVKHQLRTRAKVFVHNAGNGGLRGRNGTDELLRAMRLVKSPAKLLLRSQVQRDWPPYPELLGKVTLTTGVVPADSLYEEGDVFVFPEKFNGLSLPLQEAHAAGMLVMATDRFPNNEWLPTDPLIKVSHYERSRVAARCVEFDEAILDPKDIAEKIDDWYDADITAYSEAGAEYAKENSWDVLKPRYLRALSE